MSNLISDAIVCCIGVNLIECWKASILIESWEVCAITNIPVISHGFHWFFSATHTTCAFWTPSTILTSPVDINTGWLCWIGGSSSFLCQSAPCLDFICSRKLVVELPTRIILTVSMGIFASGEIYVKIINKHLSKPGPRSCTLRNWQVLSHPPFPGHTSLYSAAPKVSFLNQQGLLTCVCFPSESSVFSQMEQMNACRFLLLLLPQIERV